MQLENYFLIFLSKSFAHKSKFYLHINSLCAHIQMRERGAYNIYLYTNNYYVPCQILLGRHWHYVHKISLHCNCRDFVVVVYTFTILPFLLFFTSTTTIAITITTTATVEGKNVCTIYTVRILPQSRVANRQSRYKSGMIQLLLITQCKWNSNFHNNNP